MPQKPVKRSFKIWMLADSATGYVLKFSVYEGKTGNTVEKGLGANVVMRLTENLHHGYHHVYFDNFFMGIDLMLNLLRHGTYGCGTMRADRKGFPESLKALTKRGLSNRGNLEMVRNGNLCVCVWQDTKPISCCFSNSEPSVSTVSRKQKDGSVLNLNCPTAIVNYNAKMGGVDRNDQLRGYYNIEIKSRKYYFYATLDVTITNTFIMSKFFPTLKQKNLKE